MEDVVLTDSKSSDEPFVLAGGALLWAALREPSARADLEESFGAPRGAASDLADLLTELCRRGVVERVAE
jgi:hypothetical protein